MEIQFQQGIDIAKSFQNFQGYLNIDSYFAFDCLACVWECLKVQKIHFCQVQSSGVIMDKINKCNRIDCYVFVMTKS